jgi:hypothetical protein
MPSATTTLVRNCRIKRLVARRFSANRCSILRVSFERKIRQGSFDIRRTHELLSLEVDINAREPLSTCAVVHPLVEMHCIFVSRHFWLSC